MGLHEFPVENSGIPGETWPEDTWIGPAKRLEVTKLNPKFTERRYTCTVCRDTGYTRAGEIPVVFVACDSCLRGEGIAKTWERAATEREPDVPESQDEIPNMTKIAGWSGDGTGAVDTERSAASTSTTAPTRMPHRPDDGIPI